MTDKSKKIINIVVTALLYAVMLVLVLFVVFAFVTRSMSDKGKPWLFGYGFYQIITGSMEPEIAVGDIVVAKDVKNTAVKVGDNVVFKYQNKIVTHKVISINQDGSILTHGVSNSEGSNEHVQKSDIIAVQVGIINGMGNFVDFLRSPVGFILFIFVPLAAIVGYYSFSLSKNLKEYKKTEKSQDEIKDEIARLKSLLSEKEQAELNSKDNEKQDNEIK